jgi:porin
MENGTLFLHAEGSWSKSGGIGDPSVGSIFGVNDDGAGRRAIDLTELWYEHSFFDDTFKVRLGKIDLTGGFHCRTCPVSFDGSSFANDETGQFLNAALVNNPTIPFPDNGLGAVLYYNPVDDWYISAGAGDAEADARETDFSTAFHDEDYFFYVLETGITPVFDSSNGPLQGAYRIGVWNDPQPKSNSDNDALGKCYHDDTGFYLSFDQMLARENNEDDQGLGAFFRYGYAPSKSNDVTQFVSFGFQYKGLLDGRDEDVLGFGFAHGTLANTANMTYTDDFESVSELYYSIVVNEMLSISPSVQYVANPGGVESVHDAVVFGIRAQIGF